MPLTPAPWAVAGNETLKGVSGFCVVGFAVICALPMKNSPLPLSGSASQLVLE